MKTFKRGISLLLCLCVLCGCMLGLTGCASSSTLFTVDGTAVSDGFFSFYMYQYLAAMIDDLGENMPSSSALISESQTVGDYVKETIYDSILNDYATIALGKEHGITLNDSDRKDAEEYKTAFAAQLTAGGGTYKQMLRDLGCTDADVLLFCENLALLARITKTLFADESPYYPSEDEVKSISDDFYKNYICITYVIQSTTDVTGAVLSEAELKVSREACEAARDAFIAGEDDEKVVKEYSEDIAGRQSPYTIYFTLDSITDEALHDGIEPLRIGDVSDILETSNGYVVAKRLELDPDQIDSLITAYMEDNVEARLQTITDEFSVFKTPEYDAFSMAF